MVSRRRQQVTYFLGLATALFGLWLLLSGRFEIKFLFIGAGASLVVAYACMPLLYMPSMDGSRTFFLLGASLPRTLAYWLWVLKEVVVASLVVSKEVLRPVITCDPQIVFFSMPFENPMARAMLANSISLTPGTITLDVSDEGVFAVHALNTRIGDDLLRGEMARRVAILYEETCQFVPYREKLPANRPKERGVL